MNFFKNKIVAMILPVLAGAVWVPQLLGGSAAPAGLADEDDVESDAWPVQAQSLPDAGGARAEPTVEPTGNELLDSLERSLAAMETMEDTERPNSLESALAVTESGAGSGASQPPAGWTADPADLGPSALERVLQSLQLRAVIHGADRSVAMLGDRLVSAGDEVASGVRVQEIGPRWIVLQDERERARLELSDFVARPAQAFGTATPQEASSSEPDFDTDPIEEELDSEGEVPE